MVGVHPGPALLMMMQLTCTNTLKTETISVFITLPPVPNKKLAPKNYLIVKFNFDTINLDT